MKRIETIKEEVKINIFKYTHRRKLDIIDWQLREVLLEQLVVDYLEGRVDRVNFVETSSIVGPRIDLVALAKLV